MKKDNKFIENNKESIKILRIGPKKEEDSKILLDSAFESIKLNYKCPKGTVDDSNACGLEGQESNPQPIPTLPNGEIDMDGKLPDGTYVHNFSEGTDYFKSKEFKNTSAGMLFTERQAHYLREFTGPGSHSVNEQLEKGNERELRKHPNDFDSRMLKNLDNAMKRSTINRTETLYTGLDYNRALKFENANPGDVITFKRFISTSRDIDQAEKFSEGGIKDGNRIEKTILEIEVPSGVHGIDMVPFAEPGSYKVTENEVLLDRGLSFQVVDKSKKDSHTIVKVKVIK